MKNQETYKHYLRDLIYLLKDRNETLKNKQDKTQFDEGIGFAYNSIIETMANQADAFKIDFDDIGFNDFENFKKKNK